MGAQLGFLEPTGELAASPYTVEAIFGHAAPSPLVMNGGAADNHMDIGGANYGVAPMSGVQTYDTGVGPLNPIDHQPHAKNLLRPMHSESFWVLLLGAALLGLFSVGANLKLGPVAFGGKVGK